MNHFRSRCSALQRGFKERLPTTFGPLVFWLRYDNMTVSGNQRMTCAR
jgi:hypothetical protein